MKLQEVYEGWKNLLIPASDLKNKIKEVKERRTKLCKGCKYHSSKNKSLLSLVPHCTLCKCPTASKTACLSCSCALVNYENYGIEKQEPLWLAEIGDDDEIDLDTHLSE